jgi:hypothetical protein
MSQHALSAMRRYTVLSQWTHLLDARSNQSTSAPVAFQLADRLDLVPAGEDHPMFC